MAESKSPSRSASPPRRIKDVRRKRRAKQLENPKPPSHDPDPQNIWILLRALIVIVILVLLINAGSVFLPTYQKLPETINNFGLTALGALIGYFVCR